MDINVSNIPNPVTMEQRVYISKPYSYKMEQRDTAMIKLAIKNFAFEGIELGDITVDTIPVVKEVRCMLWSRSQNTEIARSYR